MLSDAALILPSSSRQGGLLLRGFKQNVFCVVCTHLDLIQEKQSLCLDSNGSIIETSDNISFNNYLILVVPEVSFVSVADMGNEELVQISLLFNTSDL